MAIAMGSTSTYLTRCIHCGIKFEFESAVKSKFSEFQTVQCPKCLKYFNTFTSFNTELISDLAVLRALSRGSSLAELAKKYAVGKSAITIRLGRIRRRAKVKTNFQLIYKFATMTSDKFNSAGRYVGSNQKV